MLFLPYPERDTNVSAASEKQSHEAVGATPSRVQRYGEDAGFKNSTKAEQSAVENADNNNGKIRNNYGEVIMYKADNPKDDEAKGKRDLKDAAKAGYKVKAKDYLNKQSGKNNLKS